MPLVEEFQKRGMTVSVLTTAHSGCPDEEVVDGVKIYRAGHNTLLDKVYNLFGTKNRRNVANATSSHGGLKRRILEKFIDKTWRQSYWPDGSKLFLKPGFKKAKEVVEADNISKVISVGLPFTCHWIAKQLKEELPQLHWHMDIQDPFSYSKEFWVNNFSRYEQKNKNAEAAAFAIADSISVTNPRAKEKYLELFPESQAKLTVIPPLFHAEPYEGSYDMILFSRKVHLGYFGSFYTGVRSPLLFLKFLKYLLEEDPQVFDKVQFHFVGQLDSRTAAILESFPELRGHLVRHGFKNRAETLDAMSQVDILLNFGNTTDYHLPSKVVDCLYMNKPVMNITSIDNDSTQIFLAGKLDLLNLKLKEGEFDKQKAAFLGFIAEKWESKVPDFSSVEAYKTQAIAEGYHRLLSPTGHKKRP